MHASPWYAVRAFGNVQVLTMQKYYLAGVMTLSELSAPLQGRCRDTMLRKLVLEKTAEYEYEEGLSLQGSIFIFKKTLSLSPR
jgi:hypothetical protein